MKWLIAPVFALLLFSPMVIEAQTPATVNANTAATAALEEARLPDPLQVGSVQDFVGRIIKAILGLSGMLALVMFVWGGITWMMSQGVPDKIKKGQQTILWAILGMALLFGSYAILGYVINALQQSTG